MGDYLWHYTGSKEGFSQKRDDGRVDIIGVNGRIIHTAKNADDARSWAKRNGYKLS